MLILGMNQFVQNLLIMGFVGICILMVLTVLIQRPTGGGLSGAFGSGAGSGQTAFGAKTGDALTIATILIFVIWLLAAIALNFVARPSGPTAVTTPAATSGIPDGTAQPEGGVQTDGEADQPADEPAGEAPATPPTTDPTPTEPTTSEPSTTEQPADGG